MTAGDRRGGQRRPRPAQVRGWANSLTWASLRLSAVPGNLVALFLLDAEEARPGTITHIVLAESALRGI